MIAELEPFNVCPSPKTNEVLPFTVLLNPNATPASSPLIVLLSPAISVAKASSPVTLEPPNTA